MDYKDLELVLKSLISDDKYEISILSNAMALLYDELDDVNWVGVYYVSDSELYLGPFQGKVACIRLPYGKGVCWKSVLDEKIVNIKNVHEFSGHIACDARSNSELVVPIKKNGKVYLVVDIDSPVLNRFSYDDEINIGNICKILEEKIN